MSNERHKILENLKDWNADLKQDPQSGHHRSGALDDGCHWAYDVES